MWRTWTCRLLVLWFAYFAVGYLFLVPFSIVRDNLHIVSGLLFYLSAFAIGAYAAVYALREKNLTLIPRVVFLLTTVLMIVFSPFTLRMFLGCFECKMFVALRITFSNCSEVSRDISKQNCILFSTTYSDGKYSIIQFEAPISNTATTIKALTKYEQYRWYHIFNRYVVLHEEEQWYLMPFSGGYF